MWSIFHFTGQYSNTLTSDVVTHLFEHWDHLKEKIKLMIIRFGKLFAIWISRAFCRVCKSNTENVSHACDWLDKDSSILSLPFNLATLFHRIYHKMHLFFFKVISLKCRIVQFCFFEYTAVFFFLVDFS